MYKCIYINIIYVYIYVYIYTYTSVTSSYRRNLFTMLNECTQRVKDSDV